MNALWIWLNTPPGVSDVLNPFGLVFAAVSTVGFFASAYLAGPGGQAIARDDRQAGAIRHWSTVGLWTFGPGLFFFAIRALQINPLSFGEPIWLVGCLIALIVAAVRFANWRRKASPARVRTPSHPHDAQQHLSLPSQWERGAEG